MNTFAKSVTLLVRRVKSTKHFIRRTRCALNFSLNWDSPKRRHLDTTAGGREFQANCAKTKTSCTIETSSPIVILASPLKLNQLYIAGGGKSAEKRPPVQPILTLGVRSACVIMRHSCKPAVVAS